MDHNILIHHGNRQGQGQHILHPLSVKTFLGEKVIQLQWNKERIKFQSTLIIFFLNCLFTLIILQVKSGRLGPNLNFV